MKGSKLCKAGGTGMECFRNIVRSGAGVCALMLVVPVLGLCDGTAGAQTVPNVVMSQVTTLGTLAGGGALPGGSPAGNGMAVDANGNLITGNSYGGKILEFAPGATAGTVLLSASGYNPGGTAIDSQGNLYLSNEYNGTITKVPASGGSYGTIIDPGTVTAVCTGTDTVECKMPTSMPVSGIVAMVFDAAGDLFVTSTEGGTNPSTVYECTAACLLTGSPAPVALYAEPSAAVTEGSSSANWWLGEIAVDPWGDVFFTDSLMNGATSYQSDVKELVYSGTAYSSTPTTLYSMTPSSPSANDDQVDGVGVDANGKVYYATLYDGIFALMNNKGTVSTATTYIISTQGAKMLALDSKGNPYVTTYSNSASTDVAMEVAIHNITATASSTGSSSSTTNITTILNDQGCSPSPVVNYTAAQGGSSTTEFTAATTGSCQTVNSTGASFATTLTFTPAYGGTRTAVLTATEAGGSGSSGTANVAGFATGTLATPTFSPAPGTYNAAQSVRISDSSAGTSIYYTIDGSTPTTSSTLYSGPITVSATETINAIATSSASGVITSAVGTGAYTIIYPAATPTFSVASGSYNAAQSVTISDATSGATIYYTTDGSTPTTSSSVYSSAINVSSSTVLRAIAVASGAPTSNVAAATYVITSATNGTSLSVLTNQITLLGSFSTTANCCGALPGGSPAGNSFAADANGNLLTSNTYGNQILEFSPGATAPTVLDSSYGNPGPVALDAAGNLYIGDTYNGTVVKVPPTSNGYAAISAPGSGTPTCTGTDAAECKMPTSMPVSGIVSMVFDASGDLFFTSTDGSSNPNTVYECTAACLMTGSPAPALLWAEPTATVAEGSANASWYLGGIAVDPWGNVFFTDTLMVASANTNYQSTLKELTYSGGAYSSTPTTVYTLNIASPSAYDNQLDAVAVDAKGTVYFADQYDGVFAYANNKGAVNTTTEYTVSTQGAKMLTLDSKGNAYVATYSSSASSDVAMEIAINNITLPNAAVSGSSTASNVTTILNDGGCSTSPVIVFSATENGAASTEFSANTTGSCSSTSTGGASFATNVTFNPTVAGTHTGILTAVDTVNGGIGTANLSGITAGSAAATPTFSPAAGTYTSVQTVSLSDATPGATIYYTTDGTAPTTSSTKYTGSITVSSSESVNAIAVVGGLSNSAVATAAYTLNLPLTQTPAISVASGTYTSVQTVKITDSTLGAKIYYTTDGSTPTTSSSLYKSALTVSASETLNAIAVATGYAPSVVATANYTINLTVTSPTFSPAAGTFTTIQTVTLADATPGASIYYTTDGSTPSTGSTLYSGPVQVLGSETIKAVGVLTGYANSPVASATYTLNLPQAATPTISLGSGTYTVSQPVTISDTTTGATIYYTVDGTTPTTSSKVYSGALTLSATETLKAIAVAVGYSPSAVATSSYTVNIMPAGFALSTNPSSLTIPSTATFGTVQLTVQPEGGFTGAVLLACTGLPAGAACGFSASPVNLTNYNQPQTVTVTISTGQVAMLRHHSNPLVPEATLAVALCFLGFRKRRGVRVLLLAVVSVLGVTMLAGCGSSAPGTTTSTATITATAGSISSKTTVSITMNH
ncbi:MAG TPA: chitobiase/beta-hexosaminidase C-terminal domain-containing protein [Bryocella sp.]|nr:chitobiase/beta-hexosaminidase C-terminal domain-containing protein [Bryocella sp.]